MYRYEPVAGVWLEPLAGYLARPDLFPVQQTYSILREAQPGILVGFGEGANGDEDFVSDIGGGSLRGSEGGGPLATRQPRGKPVEDCRDLSGEAGTGKAKASQLTGPQLLELSTRAKARGENLLLRARLEPDGSIRARDERSLLEYARLRGA